MRGALAVLLLAASAFSGCTTSTDALGKGPSAASETTPFVHSESASAKTSLVTKEWKNPASRADVVWSGATSSGKLDVTIHDGGGKRVFAGSFGPTSSASSSTLTASGTPGTWTIDLSYIAYTGSVSLTVSPR